MTATLQTQRGTGATLDAPLARPRIEDIAQCEAAFDAIYREAQGDAARIPWAGLAPNPILLAWLNEEAPGLLRPGASVTVVGCGLGDDVAELAARGHDVTGFDVSATAVEWARSRHAAVADRLVQANLFDVPSRLRRRADLVVECYTLQSLPPWTRAQAAAAVAELARPHGSVLAICRARPEGEAMAEADGPPYPFTPRELADAFAPTGFHPVRPLEEFDDADTPPKLRLRGLFTR
jgi:SAM-dependent methyltransferase